MVQQVLIRGKKDGKEIPVLVDDDGKIETTATLTGDITVGSVEVSNFPATQPVSGEVTVHEIQNKVPVGTVDTVTAVTGITNKVNIDTVDHITNISNPIDVNLADDYGWDSENTPQGEQRMVEPVRMAGTAFNGSTLDTNFWTAATGTGGTVSQANGLLTLSTGTTDGNDVSITSFRQGVYVPGATNRFRGQMIHGTGTAGNVKRWGAFTATDGYFFELSGTAMRIVIRRASSDTVVAQASWSENTTYNLDSNIHTFEIYWTQKTVYFSIDDTLMHKQSGTTAPLVSTTTLPIRAECNNDSGTTTDASLKAIGMVIHRLGKLETNGMYKFISGATSGVAKYNPGRLQRVIFTPGANGNTLILYDAQSATNEMIKVGGANTAGVTVELTVMGPFFTGLYYAMTGASSTATLIYE